MDLRFSRNSHPQLEGFGIVYVDFAYFLVDGGDVVEVDAELTAGVRRPFAVFEGGLVSGIVDGFAVLEGLEEQAEAGGDAEGDERPEFHDGVTVFVFAQVGNVCGTVVLALPVFEEFEVGPSSSEVPRSGLV